MHDGILKSRWLKPPVGAGGIKYSLDGVGRCVSGCSGRKVGMTQIYQENGVVVPVTVLECGPCTVLQVRTEDRDGYHAWQLGFDDKKRKKANQAERGHAKKVSGEPKRFVREVRQDGPTEIAEGQTLTVDMFNAITSVDVTGTSKGRGFRGRHEAARVPWIASQPRREANAPAPGLIRARVPTPHAPRRASGNRATWATRRSRCGTSRSSGSTPRTTFC